MTPALLHSLPMRERRIRDERDAQEMGVPSAPLPSSHAHLPGASHFPWEAGDERDAQEAPSGDERDETGRRTAREGRKERSKSPIRVSDPSLSLRSESPILVSVSDPSLRSESPIRVSDPSLYQFKPRRTHPSRAGRAYYGSYSRMHVCLSVGEKGLVCVRERKGGGEKERGRERERARARARAERILVWDRARACLRACASVRAVCARALACVRARRLQAGYVCRRLRTCACARAQDRASGRANPQAEQALRLRDKHLIQLIILIILF